MQIHGNARLLPRQRTLMCERVRLEHWSIEEAAEAVGVSTRTVYRWLLRFDAGDAMTDRSSAPAAVPGRKPETEAAPSATRHPSASSTLTNAPGTYI